MLGNSPMAEQLAGSQEGLSSMELVGYSSSTLPQCSVQPPEC
jgi:hypothetical protein